MVHFFSPHTQLAWQQSQSTTSLIHPQTGHFALVWWDFTVTP